MSNQDHPAPQPAREDSEIAEAKRIMLCADLRTAIEWVKRGVHRESAVHVMQSALSALASPPTAAAGVTEIVGETANLRDAIDSGHPSRLLAAVGTELRSIAQYHPRGFGVGSVSVRSDFLRHLAACIGAADVLLSAALAAAQMRTGENKP